MICPAAERSLLRAACSMAYILAAGLAESNPPSMAAGPQHASDAEPSTTITLMPIMHNSINGNEVASHKPTSRHNGCGVLNSSFLRHQRSQGNGAQTIQREGGNTERCSPSQCRSHSHSG